MFTTRSTRVAWLLPMIAGLLVPGVAPAQESAKVEVNWQKVIRTSQTSATLQVVVNPPLRRGSAIHDRTFQALHDLNCDYVRFVPWFPYPRLGVAELEPPRDDKTSWDFSLVDPLTVDFLEATKGHSVILNFSTIPQWMYHTPEPVRPPDDPDKPMWNYSQGTELRDPSMQEVADYYARLLAWYTKGGFVDERGVRHDSNHHFKIDYWEFLNEVDFEHQMSPETYTRLYDAVTAAMRRVQPDIKFVALALASPSTEPQFFEYFLNPKNHAPGVPLDMISYHFYAVPDPDETIQQSEYTFWPQVERFMTTVRYVESTRQRLSPSTRTTIDEIGSIYSSDFDQGKPDYTYKPLPDAYWNLSGATYAYVYSELAKLGIDVAGESQLVGYPTQFPSVSMVDWNTGQPNARYWVLKLLRDNLGPGDKMVETNSGSPYVYAQSFLGKDGRHRILLVNKRNRAFEVAIPGGGGAQVAFVDASTGTQPPGSAALTGGSFNLQPFGVAIVTLPR